MEKIFFEGLYSNDVDDKAPEFILGKGAIMIDKMIKFLEANRQYAVNGALQYTILRAKSGGRYATLDTFAYEKQQERANQTAAQEIETHNKGYEEYTGRVIKPNESVDLTQEQINEIPF